MFYDPNTMRIEFLATAWFVKIAVVRGRSRSPRTWRQYAYDLLDAMNFIAGKGWRWPSAREEHLAHYRNELERRRLKRNTIARKMQLLCTFYQWAHESGYIESLPFGFEDARYYNKSQHDKLAPRPTIVPRTIKSRGFKRYFNKTEQERLLSALSERDRLMVLWALFTGLRLHEICALTIDQIPEERFYRDRSFYAIPLQVTKGNKGGSVYAPTWLLDATYQYMALFGRRSVRARLRRSKRKEASSHIFLARSGSGLKPASLYKYFKAALAQAGVEGTFHDLRHTYAITMLDRLMRASKEPEAKHRNALLVLKTLMRHSSLSQTEIYLSSWRFYMDDVFSDTWEIPEAVWQK